MHKSSGRRIGYGEIAAFAKVPEKLPAIEEADLKPVENFRLIGTDIARIELPLKVTGRARYGMDVQVPGMVYAAVLQSPYPGGAPVQVDDVRARAVPGVTDIFKMPGGVGVIGTTVEGTQTAKNLLRVTWSDAPGARLDSERALEDLGAIGRDKSRDGVAYEKTGDAKAAMTSAKSVFRGEYRTRYVYHAHNFWAAVDAGIAVQPRNLAAQTEGSIVYALGSVLREKITIKDGRVLQSNYSDYEVARMSDVPNIEIKIVSTANKPTGGGEEGVPLVACAVGNAIAALTGVRLRELPFSPDHVRVALGA
jgi:hypothetical protein